MRIKQSKCKWVATQAEILGHIVSGGEVKMDPKKIEALKNRQEPTNVKQTQQFLGICNYYRKFIKDYAKMAAPLNALLRKEKKFDWSKNEQEAFDNLKNALTSYPVLRQPDFSKEFWLYTDASGYCLGAVLAQKDENGKVFACTYISTGMDPAQQNYTVTEKECLTVVWAIKKFRIYLYQKFYVVTDHVALAWLISLKDPTGRLARWACYLQAYDMEIIHRKGLVHSNADALSRPVCCINSEQISDESFMGLELYENEGLITYLLYKKHIGGLPKNKVKKIENLAKYYEIDENGQLYYLHNYRRRIVPKPAERRKIVEDKHAIGHFQVI